MKQQIKIEKIEHKVSKNNTPYIKVNGEYTVFEDDLIQRFKNGIHQNFMVEIKQSGTFKNIRQIYEGEAIEDNIDYTAYRPEEIGKQIVKKEAEQEAVLIQKEKPNSRTIGKGADQIKLYFDGAGDLDIQIKNLEMLGLMPKDWSRDIEFNQEVIPEEEFIE